MTITNFILPLFLFNDIYYKARNDTIFVQAHFYPEEKNIYNSVNNKLKKLEEHLEKKKGVDIIFPSAKEVVNKNNLYNVNPCNDYCFLLYLKYHSSTPTIPKTPSKVPDKIKLDTLRVKLNPIEVKANLDTIVIKTLSQLPESLKIKHEIFADSSLLKYLEELKKQKTAIETVYVAPIPAPVIIEKTTEQGFFEIDKIKGNGFYTGIFYRNDNGEMLFFPLGFDLKTKGKMRLESVLDFILLSSIDRETSNNGLVDADFGLYNQHIGGGLNFVTDSIGNFYTGIYGKGALSLVKPVVYGIIGVNFNLNNNSEDKDYRHYVKSGIMYESNSKKFMFNLEGKSGHHLLQNKYLNSLKLILGFGDRTRLLVSAGGKTELDAENIGNDTFKEFMQKTELSGEIGAEWVFDKNVGLYVKVGTVGKWNEDKEYKTVEQGVTGGINFYFK